MITVQAENYAKLLYSMKLKEEITDKTKNLLQNHRELAEALMNPVVSENEKEAVIDALFDKEITGFLKTLCNNDDIRLFPMIMDAYEELSLKSRNIIKAKLKYTVKPQEEQLEQIKNMLCHKYDKTGVFLELEEDASLIGGYILYVGNTEYNKSISGALSEMKKTLAGR